MARKKNYENMSDYRNEWIKANMKAITVKYKKEYVDEVNEVLKKQNISKAKAIKWLFDEILKESNKKKTSN